MTRGGGGGAGLSQIEGLLKVCTVMWARASTVVMKRRRLPKSVDMV